MVIVSGTNVVVRVMCVMVTVRVWVVSACGAGTKTGAGQIQGRRTMKMRGYSPALTPMVAQAATRRTSVVFEEPNIVLDRGSRSL